MSVYWVEIAERLAQRERALRLLDLLAAADRREPAGAPGLDAHEQAQEPHPPERLERLALRVARAALQDEADVAHVAGGERGVQPPDPLAVVGAARDEEVVVVEHELADAAQVVEVRHLVGDVLGRPLPEARPRGEAVERRDAAVVAVGDAPAAAHEVGGGHPAEQARRPARDPVAAGDRGPAAIGRGGERTARPSRRLGDAGHLARARDERVAEVREGDERLLPLVDHDGVERGVRVEQLRRGARGVVAAGDDRAVRRLAA